MVVGLELFRECFSSFQGTFVLIGGVDPVFGRLDKVELRGWEEPYQEQDNGWGATSIWAGIQGEGGSGGRQE